MAILPSRVGRSRRWRNRFPFRFSSRRLFRLTILCLVLIAIVPPIFFHFKLRRFQQMQRRKCKWLNDPPLVCAHGGDSSKAFPNTMDAYSIALRSQANCVEVDVSRSSDGVLFALHDRDLQRITGSNTSKVGNFSSKENDNGRVVQLYKIFNNRHFSPRIQASTFPSKIFHSAREIKDFGAFYKHTHKLLDFNIPTIEEALVLLSKSVQQVILDAKVGPPSYENRLAKDIISVVEKTRCMNCLVWAKSDSLARDIIRFSSNIKVGYIVMKDPSTGERTNLLRMKGAKVVGTYHPLIDEKLMQILHRRDKKVYAWTVDDTDSMERMLAEGVDAVVTSNPTLLGSVMQDIRTTCLENGFSLSSS